MGDDADIAASVFYPFEGMSTPENRGVVMKRSMENYYIWADGSIAEYIKPAFNGDLFIKTNGVFMETPIEHLKQWIQTLELTFRENRLAENNVFQKLSEAVINVDKIEKAGAATLKLNTMVPVKSNIQKVEIIAKTRGIAMGAQFWTSPLMPLIVFSELNDLTTVVYKYDPIENSYSQRLLNIGKTTAPAFSFLWRPADVVLIDSPSLAAYNNRPVGIFHYMQCQEQKRIILQLTQEPNGAMSDIGTLTTALESIEKQCKALRLITRDYRTQMRDIMRRKCAHPVVYQPAREVASATPEPTPPAGNGVHETSPAPLHIVAPAVRSVTTDASDWKQV
jgi:hypothetical protein